MVTVVMNDVMTRCSKDEVDHTSDGWQKETGGWFQRH